MRCEAARDNLDALLVGALPAWRSWALRRHLGHCVACRAEMERLEAADRLLAEGMRPPDPPADLWRSIELALPEEPEEETWIESPRPRRLHAALAGMVAATALLVALTHQPAPRPADTLPPSTAVVTTADSFEAQHLLSSWRDPLADQAALGALAAEALPRESQQ